MSFFRAFVTRTGLFSRQRVRRALNLAPFHGSLLQQNRVFRSKLRLRLCVSCTDHVQSLLRYQSSLALRVPQRHGVDDDGQPSRRLKTRRKAKFSPDSQTEIASARRRRRSASTREKAFHEKQQYDHSISTKSAGTWIVAESSHPNQCRSHGTSGCLVLAHPVHRVARSSAVEAARARLVDSCPTFPRGNAFGALTVRTKTQP